MFPLAPGSKVTLANCPRCTRPERDKPNAAWIEHGPEDCRCIATGGTCHGVRAATTNPDVIRAWWAADARRGVGVATGPSGLVILDVDVHPGERPADEWIFPGRDYPHDVAPPTLIESGLDSLAVLCQWRGQTLPTVAPETLVIRTPSGGLHIWYWAPDAWDWKPSAGTGTRPAIGWQIDTRTRWTYGIAPGTVTAAGEYTALGDCRTPARLPEWIGNEMRAAGLRRQPPPPPPTGPRPTYRGGKGLVGTMLDGELTAVAKAQHPGRNAQLNASAYRIGRFVGAGLLDRFAAENSLMDAAGACGLLERDEHARTVDTIRRALDSGALRPYTPRNSA